MTLIAYTSARQIPFLIGDLLISADIKKSSFITPTVPVVISEEFLPNKDRAIHIGLNQKIYVVAKNLSIALAGFVSEMKDFLIELKNRCAYYDEITEDTVNGFLNDCDFNEAFNHLSFLILLVVPNNEGKLFVKRFEGGDWDSVESEYFGTVSACGSGKMDFLKQAGDVKGYYSLSLPDRLAYSIQVNIALLVRFLSAERASIYTIMKHWGAGFETIFFDGARFVKFDEIVYILNTSLYDDNGFQVPQPVLLMHYKYYDNILVITRLEIKATTLIDDGNWVIISSDDLDRKVFTVLPIDLPQNEDSYEACYTETFETNRIAMGYIFTDAEFKHFTVPAAYSDAEHMVVRYSNGKLEIQIKREMNEAFLKTIATEFPRG